MNQREKVLLKELELTKQTIISNRDIFYLMANHKGLKFKDQEECDDLIAKLISERKINKEQIYGDDQFKPNKKLEQLLRED